MIHQAVYEHLSADSSVTALCSAIYAVARPLDTGAPFMVLTLEDDRRERLVDGSQGGYRHAIFSVDCYDTQLADVIAIADAVESSLVDYRGLLGSTSPQVTADHIRVERRGPHIHESDTRLHRVPLEFFMGYY